MKKICLNCGKELPIDSAFCSFCGSSNLSNVKEDNLICPKCGKTVPSGNKFCIYCGEPLINKKPARLDITEEKKIETAVIQEPLTPIEPQKEKTYKGKFTASLIVNFVLLLTILIMISYMGSISGTTQDHENLNSSNIGCSAGEYDETWYSYLNKIVNQRTDSVFYANTYFIDSDVYTLKVYLNANDTVNWDTEYYGEYANCSNFSDWKTDEKGIPYFEIVFNTPKGTYGISRFTLENDSSRSFYVFFSNLD